MFEPGSACLLHDVWIEPSETDWGCMFSQRKKDVRTLSLTQRWHRDVHGERLRLRNIEGWSYWLQWSNSPFWCCTPQQSRDAKHRQSLPLRRCGHLAKRHLRLKTAGKCPMNSDAQSQRECFTPFCFLTYLTAWWPWAWHLSSGLCVGHTAPLNSGYLVHRIHLWGNGEMTSVESDRSNLSSVRVSLLFLVLCNNTLKYIENIILTLQKIVKTRGSCSWAEMISQWLYKYLFLGAVIKKVGLYYILRYSVFYSQRDVSTRTYRECCIMGCLQLVARFASVFKSVYSVSFRVSQPSNPQSTLFAPNLQQFLKACVTCLTWSEHESEVYPDVFTAEMDRWLNHL